MNRRQKSVIINFVIVAIVTTLFAVVMTNVKDFVNKSEGLRAMTLLAEHIQKYRKEYKSLPPESKEGVRCQRGRLAGPGLRGSIT